MSLYDNALTEMNDLVGDTHKAVKVWDWVRSEMDFVKFRTRVAYSRNDDAETKVVLMEYKSTWRRDDQTTNFYIPGTGINTSCLQYDRKVLDYLHYMIADHDSRVLVYTRRKIVDGTPHPILRQLVVKFNVAKTTYVAPPVPPSPIEKLDDDDYSGMPPLVSVRHQ